VFKGYQQSKKSQKDEQDVTLALSIENKSMNLKISKIRRQIDDFKQQGIEKLPKGVRKAQRQHLATIE